MGMIAVSGKKGSGKDTVGKIMQIIIDSPHFTDEAVEDFLKRKVLNSKFEIKKFADPLKDMICIILGCSREQLESEEYKSMELPEDWWYWKLERDGGYSTILLPYITSTPPKGYEGLILIKPTPRLLLQQMGTECGRNILHPQIWVNALMSKYKTVGGDKTKLGTLESIGKYPNWIISDLRFPNEMEAVVKRKGLTIRVNRPNPNGIISDFKNSIQNLHESEVALDNAEFDCIVYNNGTILNLIKAVRELLTDRKII